MRASDFIVEAFNQPYSFRWEQGEQWYDALATLDDGTYLSIMFNNNGDDEWQIEFHRNASQEVTGAGDAQRVFATVLAAIQQFIQKERPWRIIFSASKDVQPGQNSQSRAKLYNSLVARYARAWGYDEYNEDHGDQVTYELTRLKQDINESTFREHEDQLRDFIKWCVRKLDIQQALPRIRFQDAKEGPDQHRTGYYDDNDDIMWIYTGNRNLIDIMRTVAHELAHRKQHEDNRVHGDQAYPGSPIEQEADAVAGYLMKLYGKENPEIIE